jgi:proline dehydrogenase
LPVPGLLAPPRTLGHVLAGRWVAGPRVEDALRVAAELVSGGLRVAVEHRPGPDEDAGTVLGELIGRVQAAGIGAACEVTLPVDRLGVAATRALAGTAADAGAAVVVAGPSGAVRAASDGLPSAGAVVHAAQPDAEAVCRALAGARVRLLAGRGAAADLAFVRCLNVLMAGSGRPAFAAGDPRLVAIVLERAAWNERSPDSWEYVMSYGIRTEQQRRLAAAGHAVRVAVPSGRGAVPALARRLAGRA